MKELLEETSQPRLIVFEGVRNDESSKRASYNRIGEGVKHVNLINCRPILKWNTTEIYLYMYKNGLQINPAYTLGLTRVGCGVCPFASDWSEYVIRKRYPQIATDYIGVVDQNPDAEDELQKVIGYSYNQPSLTSRKLPKLFKRSKGRK